MPRIGRGMPLKGSFIPERKTAQKMFQLAADYERKAKRAEALEVSLQRRQDDDALLAPEIAESVTERPDNN